MRHALKRLDVLLQGSENWNLKNECEAVKGNYLLLLKYLQNGVIDDKRDSLFHDFIRQSFSLADSAMIDIKAKDSNEEYFSQKRAIKQRNLQIKEVMKQMEAAQQKIVFLQMTESPDSPATKEMQNQMENLSEDLFNLIWTSTVWEDDEENLLRAYLDSPSSDTNIKLTLVAALVLSSLFFFSSQKISLFSSLTLSDNPEISLRALVGIILTVFVYNNRLEFYPQALQVLESLGKMPNLEENLTFLQTSLINVLNSKNIERKINDEILPALYKKQSSGMDFSKIDELLNEESDSDELLNNKKLKDLQNSVQSMMEMEKQGADMPFATFSHLKTFPFFNKAVNWFRPFDFLHSPTPANILINSPLFRSILISPSLCDSDKYSLCLVISAMPEGQRDQISKGLEMQMGEGALHDTPFENSEQEPKDILRNFVQNCYRFFNLFRNRSGMPNPFKQDILITSHSRLSSLFTNKEPLLKIVYFAHKLELWDLASRLFGYIDKNYNLPADAYRVYGYDLQKQKNFSQAIICYEKASLIDSESQWTKRRLGLCYLRMGNIPKALAVYNQLYQLTPDNATILLHYAECLSLSRKFEQALPLFFKLEYLNPQNAAAIRGVAWCSLQSDNAKQADKYYGKLLNNECSAQDFRNAGHAAWASDKLDSAIVLYKKSKDLASEKSEFLFSADDIQLLEDFGKTELDIHFVSDIINS